MRVFKKSELAGVRGWFNPSSVFINDIGIPDLDFHILHAGDNEECSEANESFARHGYVSIKGQQLIDRLTSIGYQVIDDTQPAQPKHEKFWMVWSPQSPHLQYRSICESDAINESVSMAKNNPESEFYILEAQSVTTAGKVKREMLVKPYPTTPF